MPAPTNAPRPHLWQPTPAQVRKARARANIAARTPAATPSYMARATSVRATPRWRGSHWATGSNAPVRKLARKAPPAGLSAQQVANRIKYGY